MLSNRFAVGRIPREKVGDVPRVANGCKSGALISLRVSLRGVNLGRWSHIGFVGLNATISSCERIFYGAFAEITLKKVTIYVFGLDFRHSFESIQEALAPFPNGG